MAPVRSAGRLFSPLDNELQLLPGGLTPLLQERLVQVGTVARSFAEGAGVFFSFTRTPVSEPTARRCAERAGAVMAAWESEGSPTAPAAPPALEARETEVREPEARDARPSWVGADGVFVRLVGGAWREVRTVTLGRVNPPRVGDEAERVSTTDLSYFSRLTDSAEVFLDDAAVEFQRREIAAAARVGAGADGAEWCQRLFDRYCPQAVRSLDFYHAAERVADFSKVLWQEQPELAHWYVGERLHHLKHDGPADLLASLAAWSAAGGPAVRVAAQQQYQFFASREALLDYPAVRAAGLPIGTGNAESANRHVIQDRLKGPGKFWAEAHVNPMLALRGAWCSERWEEAWQATSKRLAEGHHPLRLFHAPKTKS
jgi:hypothetical protein